ncbi:hypothetical protein BAE44_0010252 [Dichanthelium oligosanthes]|uniref:Transmembrane protein n=1 Tax=Dichanthelium oligosanthes TaxID=888268 RepID=A0A1E5VUE8_9POAL|nr:hypothetical protein BAE44_0010252 [Dichanthelium oligosanthes]
MADIDNSDGDGGALATRAEPDDDSGCGMLCGVALATCTFIAMCVLLVLFYRGQRTAAALGVRVLATIMLVLGSVGFLLAACCCIVLVQTCLCGNVEGKQQQAQEEEPILPA